MKDSFRNNASFSPKITPQFSEKRMAKIRMKLKQLAEIEFLYYEEKKKKKRRKNTHEKCDNLYTGFYR